VGGVLLMTMLANILNILGLGPASHQVATGLVIIAAVVSKRQ